MYNKPYEVAGVELSADEAKALGIYVAEILDANSEQLAFVKMLQDGCQFWSVYLYNDSSDRGNVALTAVMMNPKGWSDSLITDIPYIAPEKEYHVVSALTLRLSNPLKYLKVKSYFTPTEQELEMAESVLHTYFQFALDNYPTTIYPRLAPVMLPFYQRQYVGYVGYVDYVDSEGYKQIWISCFRAERFTSKKLSSDVIIIHDGGSAFWNITIDLEKGELHSLNINEVA